MTERNIRLVVEYKGTSFAGWQIQNDQPTVQGALTDAVFQVTGREVTITGAGRTDAGVHALGQVANFRIDHHLESERFRDAINFYLPDDIRVKKSDQAPDDFNARFSARHRRYRYLIGRERSALYREYRWETETGLTFDTLREAAQRIEGEHDFSPFCVTASRRGSNVCTIEHSRWRSIGPLLVYEIRGNRFLHSMVRSLVGAMVNIASTNPDSHPANLTLDSFTDIINVPSDIRIPFTAPAHGLYLVSVGY